MILYRQASREGAIYQVARASDRFPLIVHQLVREARTQGLPLAIGERLAGDCGGLVVGPLGADEDEAFRARWALFIEDRPPGCESSYAPTPR